MKLAQVEEFLAEVRAGRVAVLVRDADTTAVGHLVLGAEKASPETVDFMIAHGGDLTVALTADRLETLGLPITPPPVGVPVATANGSDDRRAQVADETTRWVHALADPRTRSIQVEMPSSLSTVRARWGGVLTCATPFEAAVDVSRLAGLAAVSVLSRIPALGANGSRPPGVAELADRHRLKVLSIAELIDYRRRKAPSKLAHVATGVRLPTRRGTFLVHAYEDPLTGLQHLALVRGEVADSPEPVMARMHSECFTGDILGSLRCDCGPQLDRAMKRIDEAGKGVLLYLRQEGRGIGLDNKLAAYAFQDEGFDTVEANEQLGFAPDLRDYGVAAEMLADLGVREVELMTNNPKKIAGLEHYGIRVTNRLRLHVGASDENRLYLQTKLDKMGHQLRSHPALSGDKS